MPPPGLHGLIGRHERRRHQDPALRQPRSDGRVQALDPEGVPGALLAQARREHGLEAREGALARGDLAQLRRQLQILDRGDVLLDPAVLLPS